MSARERREAMAASLETTVLHAEPCLLAGEVDVERLNAVWDNTGQLDACSCPEGYPRVVCSQCFGEGGRHSSECERHPRRGDGE